MNPPDPHRQIQGTLDFEADARAEILAQPPRPGVAGRTAWAAAARGEHGPYLQADEVRAALGHDVWELAITAPGRRHTLGPALTPGRCQGTLFDCVTGSSDRDRYDENALIYRGACLGCNWEGPVHDDENPAVEDACDHAWPGWRDLPVVANPKTPKAIETVTALYEQHWPGWWTGDAPLRSNRTSRHYWSPALHRWDIAAGAGQ